MKFSSSVGGQVTGVRFYKQTWMGGYTHVGHFWSSSGALLASVLFTNETSYGWEQANFSSPVTIQPDTTYIVSFSTGGGYFGITSGYFNAGGVTSGPLTAPGGGNGVYQYAGRFPSVNGSGMSFWVDVAFSPNSPSIQAAASSASASGTTGRAGYLIGTTAAAAQPAGYLIGTTFYRRAAAQAQQPVLWGARRSGFLS